MIGRAALLVNTYTILVPHEGGACTLSTSRRVLQSTQVFGY